VTTRNAESLNQSLADLHAERVATWRPEDLAVNVEQRRLLVDTENRAAYVKVGDVVESFTVPGVDGSLIEFDELAARGPVVLLFFRFAGCPACNIALPYYQRTLWPALRDLGATLLALSPQVPDRLLAIKEKHGLEFLVGSDLNNELGRRFGILYSYDEPSKQAALSRNSSIGEVTGTGTWELPKPAVLVVGADRVLRFVDVSPDWLLRTEAGPIIEAVRTVNNAARATSNRSHRLAKNLRHQAPRKSGARA
jgi:peroxiredoxin